MNPTVAPTAPARRRQLGPLGRGIVVGAVLAAVGAAGVIAIGWFRFGAARPSPNPLLDALMPDCDVAERHEIDVDAPADVTFAAARELDLFRSPIVRIIFAIRTIPSRLHGDHEPELRPASFVDQTLALGWGMLAEVPNRAIVMGAVTKPWEPVVTFHAVPAQEFRRFHAPGFAKVVWTLEVEPLGPSRSRLRTETRVATTDAEARRRFRRYWAVFSPGIVAIRWEALRLVKAEAERRARPM
jgi:hypothetical protein